jgi:hypothetical protein
MSKGHDTIQGIEDYRMINHAIVVQLAQVFHFCNSSLVVFEVVLLQPKHDVFQDVIDDSRNKVLMITVQCTGYDSKQMDISILDLARF